MDPGGCHGSHPQHREEARRRARLRPHRPGDGHAVGHISGGHFNPAVTIGAAAGGRIAWRKTPAYILTQVVAGIAAGYDLLAWLVIEVLLTAFFLWVILGTTDSRAPKGLAPLVIGLSLTLIHLTSIPVTNTSVNPARSIGVGLFAGGDAIAQLWLFILAPIVGGVVAGLTYAFLLGDEEAVSLPEAMET